MRLDELTGTRRFQDRDFWSVLRDFQQAGGEHLGSGRFAHVIGHRAWAYVLKVFPEDWCYRSFVEWAIENPHPCLPRFYGPPKLITPFWKRETSHVTMWVVKQERLEEARHDVARQLADLAHSADAIMRYEELPEIEKIVALDQMARDELELIDRELAKQIEPDLRRRLQSERRDRMADLNPMANRVRETRAFWQAHRGTRAFTEMVANHLSKAPIRCELDAHAGNIMIRPSDGSYVFVDPFWHGSNPYADHDAMIRSEIGALDDDPPMLRGRETSLPRPKAASQPRDDSEIPF